jgi:hypothetical protein
LGHKFSTVVAAWRRAWDSLFSSRSRRLCAHERFVVHCQPALLGTGFYLVLVHRLAIYVPGFLPTLGRLMQLRFISFVVINVLRGLHPQ